MTQKTRLNFFKDPFSHIFFEQWGYKGVLFFTTFPFILLIFISLAKGTFFEISIACQLGLDEFPFVKDLPFWGLMVIVVSTASLLYSLFKSAPISFQRLIDRQVLLENKEEKTSPYQTILSEFENKANDVQKTFIFGFIFLVLYLGPIAITTQTQNLDFIAWTDFFYFPIAWYSMQAVFSFYVFFVGVVMWKIYVLMSLMRTLFNEKFCKEKGIVLNLQPINPDKCAGLYPLGALSFKLSQVLLAFGFFVVFIFTLALIQPQSMFWTWIMGGIYALIIYVPLASFFFFYPLSSAHNLMLNEKNRLLDQLSAQLGVLYTKLLYDLAQKGSNVDKDEIEKHLLIRQLYSEAEKMPLWPFDTETLLKFSMSVIFPLSLVVAEAILLFVFNVMIA